jgi:hypothetical protein
LFACEFRRVRVVLGHGEEGSALFRSYVTYE